MLIRISSKYAVLIFFFILRSFTAVSQINESQNHEVYNYLYRMAQKGLVEWKDQNSPLDRKTILNALIFLQTNLSELSKIEKIELKFYLKEFAFDSTEKITNDKSYFKLFTNNRETRYRTLLIEENNNKLFLEPQFGVSHLSSNGKSNTTYFGGVRLAGYFGKHIGINFSFRDVTEKGDTIDYVKSFTNQQGIVATGQTNNTLNYGSLNFNASYKWNRGMLTIGKDNLIFGYGMGGNIILSGKSPSFPFVLFNYTPWKWVHFNYFHGWLQSDVIDSAKSYNTGSGVAGSKRFIYRQKFIANHSLIINPVKGLDIGIGESMVYSDKLNIGYLIPINFFKAYDHYTSDYAIESGSNAQFFALISSKNQIKNTHLYAQIFVDEIKLSKIFNKKESRNQLGYTIGFNRTDVLLNYLSIGVEYTRINPFVYNNLIPTQTYASHSYSLGDWMGNNADRIFVRIDYTPLPKLKLKAEFQKIRKGGAGNLQQQYNQQPQPDFLFDKSFSYQEINASISYELINTLKLFAKATRIKYEYPTLSSAKTGVNIGFSYSLY
ncbi:MAG: capsule assembly Wzi family protein [Bacteroidota bacterium]|nr:capsule assembly Wzi family protein [Bacteroidota bacterium]